jgi:serine/threonine protein kinase/Flp pilus assembly protein TadD
MSRLVEQTNSSNPLGGRYKVISKLGAGGFGETFLAEDLHLPGNPLCVVKKLKPQTTESETLSMARRLFDTEAKVLYQLGNHEQIPRLLAHFEDNQEFYLAQELIEGEPLSHELVGQPWSEDRVIALLEDVLEVLAFVHEQNVIHRDIKPPNLIRRRRDGRIVLIDFGAVKQVSSQVVDPETGQTNLTISIGTKGYMPNEQLAGNPRFSSDVYAVGLLGIFALTGTQPKRFSEDPETNEINWREHTRQVSPELGAILDQMVRYDFRDRYPTATEALLAIRSLTATQLESEAFEQQLYCDREGEAPTSLELQPPLTGTEATESDTQELPTNIWVPTEALSETATTASTTNSTEPLSETATTASTTNSTEPLSETATTASTTNSTEPLSETATTASTTDSTEPLSETATTASTTDSTEPLSQQEPTLQVSKISAPVVSTSGEIQGRFVKLWPVLAVLAAVGASSLLVKTVLFSQPASQTTDRGGAAAPTPIPTRSAASTPTPTPPPPKKPQASELLSQADRLRQAGEYQKALELYDQAIALKPNVAQAYWGRCYSLNKLNKPTDAIVSCNDALDLKPNYPEALLSKGNAQELQKLPIEAIQLYERATEIKPNFAEAWVSLGRILQSVGRSEEAISALDKAIALKRNSAEAWSIKGAALMNLGRFEPAIASFDKALQIQPDNQDVIKMRKLVQQQLGR